MYIEEHFFSILVIPPNRLASHLVNVLHLLSLKEKSGDVPPLPSHKHAQAFFFFLLWIMFGHRMLLRDLYSVLYNLQLETVPSCFPPSPPFFPPFPPLPPSKVSIQEKEYQI